MISFLREQYSEGIDADGEGDSMPREWIISEEDLGCDGAYYSHEEIVRCKDCRYYNGEYKYCDNDIFVKPNGYCSYGKRKEDDQGNGY